MSDENDSDRLTSDEMRAFAEKNDITTNDAVAGETVEPGRGEGNAGPTGGSPREFEPVLDEHQANDDPNNAPADLDDSSESAQAGPVQTTAGGDGGGRGYSDPNDAPEDLEHDE